jgi:uncharacterized protein
LTQLSKLQKEVQKRMLFNEPSHDFEHVMRVYRNAQKICKKERVSPRLVLPSVLLHDIVSISKFHKDSKSASTQSARKAKKILQSFHFSDSDISTVCRAINDHSFSKNKTPKTIEGKILQDADRLDALGAIGIARVFAVGGSGKRPFYKKTDPFCKKRKPDDMIWTIDHFYKKLLLLESCMNTKSAKLEARKRTKRIKRFLADLRSEI